ncbi:hypothetical protein BBJ29_005825 [Phytophthora kernoviae]|uniref:CAAX prenyl protease n=1 Tax=Phytophthora kernoviae TaxID=325452 RepID=A0A3F2RNA5_9STRA|nr:hypothetical protein BBP00_00005896 [Phytophthora kernoviae]RLN61214.1 hypothetical protein BBJ29_005825 [Phytophthora kernoviae]
MSELSWWQAPYFTETGWRPSASAVPYFQGALLFMTLVYLFETYLDVRQHRKLHDATFPKPLEEAIEGLGSYQIKKKAAEAETEADNIGDAEEKEETEKKQEETTLLEATLSKFDKSRAYGLDKSTFGFIHGAYNQLEATVFLLLGYLPFMWTISGQTLVAVGLDADNEIYRALMLLTLTTTLGLFFMDKIKSFLLFIVIGFPVTAALIYVIRWGGEYFYMYVWAFLFVFSVIMMTLYPVLIMPLFNKFTPLEEGELRTRIEALAASLNFPLTKLFVTDGSKRSSHSNAYFFGFFKSKRIVLFDTLLEQATHDEIVAVLGHELGHWKLWHTAQGFVIQQAYILASFYVFGLCMNDAELFVSFGFAGDSAKPVIIGFLLFSQTMWAPVEHVLSFLITLNTRKNEFQADAFAVDLGHDIALKSGLTKLAIENLSNMNPDKLYSAYHYSHPPLVERLNAITARAKKAQ